MYRQGKYRLEVIFDNIINTKNDIQLSFFLELLKYLETEEEDNYIYAERIKTFYKNFKS
jgi:hypothetical protein